MKRRLSPVASTVLSAILGTCVFSANIMADDQQPLRQEKTQGADLAIKSQNCSVPRLEKTYLSQKTPTRYYFGLNPCDERTRNLAPAVLTSSEAQEAWRCLQDELLQGWRKSGQDIAEQFTQWPDYATAAFRGIEQNGCYAQIYATGDDGLYGKWGEVGLPIGAKIAKASFAATPDGKLLLGSLPVMEKTASNWTYILILANGDFDSTRNRAGKENLKACVKCHENARVPSGDPLFFPPRYYQKSMHSAQKQ